MSYLANTLGKRTRQVYVFKPSSAGNVFSGLDYQGQSLKFIPSPQATSVYVNGFQLAPEDWTGNAAGTQITIARNITAGDVMVVVAEATYGTTDVLKQSANLSDVGNRETVKDNLWTNPVFCRITRNNGTETFVNNTNYACLWLAGGTMASLGPWNYDNLWIKVPYTGWYRITNSVYMNGALTATGARLGIVVNGETLSSGQAFVHWNPTAEVGTYMAQAIVPLNAGDTLAYRCTQGDLVVHTAPGHTEVMVELVKRTA